MNKKYGIITIILLIMIGIATVAQDTVDSIPVDQGTVDCTAVCDAVNENNKAQLAECVDAYSELAASYQKLGTVLMVHMEVSRSLDGYFRSHGIVLEGFSDESGNVSYSIAENGELKYTLDSLNKALNVVYDMLDAKMQ